VRRRIPTAFLVVLVCIVCTGAGTGGARFFDASTLPAAFPGSENFDDAAVVAELQRILPSNLSVAAQEHIIVAAPGATQDAARQARRIADYEEYMRQRSFPDLRARRILVVLGESPPAYRRLAKTLYPGLSDAKIPSSGFYHSRDRLILVTTENDPGAVLRQLMRALVRDDNPEAPYWFEEAAATLYESSEWRANRLTPLLNQRMKHIAPDEDLSYDVFAGICDCSPVSPEQLALMRLLLVFLEERDELADLHTAVKRQGRFTTLLEALQAMQFDRSAWKEFAEQRARSNSQ
jgi:hypothetical protein